MDLLSRIVLKKLDHQTLHDINPRYLYGELRLSRLNLINRCCSATTNFSTFIRGYQLRLSLIQHFHRTKLRLAPDSSCIHHRCSYSNASRPWHESVKRKRYVQQSILRLHGFLDYCTSCVTFYCRIHHIRASHLQSSKERLSRAVVLNQPISDYLT